MNPLFSEEPVKAPEDNSYLLARPNKQHVKPLSHADNPAVEMLRRKIDAMYLQEPSAKQEAAEVKHLQAPGSKHQNFMRQLTTSGKSMAEIQTAWHNYYAALPDNEKHDVWQEFYRANAKDRQLHAQNVQQNQYAAPYALEPAAEKARLKPVIVSHEAPTHEEKQPDKRSAAGIKKQILKRVSTSRSTQEKAKQHLQSLAFGIGVGTLALLIALFGLFNELVVAPFIRPGSAAATPIILNSGAPAPSSSPEVIIPKLNAQLPVVYGGQSLAESEVQKALEDGVFHYPTTAVPGQNGNVAIFGHSSNNIFNKGKYKFAFVLLKELEPGDIFYMTYEGKVYTYKVYGKKIVNPEDTWVLGPVEGKVATVALITCDPPGTTRHRLVVWGEQIGPDPSDNSTSATPSEALKTQDLPGKGPNTWTRFWRSVNPLD
ncbi:MAG TPA: class D sortase [Candidatus Saccharimonadales bacterium]